MTDSLAAYSTIGNITYIDPSLSAAEIAEARAVIGELAAERPAMADPELAGRAHAINAAFDSLARREAALDSKRLAIGRMLVEARAIVERRRQDWPEWVAANIRRSHRDCNRVMALARAPDPAVAVAEEKARNAAAQRKARTDVSPAAAQAALLRLPATCSGQATRYAGLSETDRGLFAWFATLSRGKQKRFLALARAN